MGDRLAEFWCEEFQGAHGIPYPFAKVDGVILHALKKQHGRYALAWMIKEFHEMHDDTWLQANGWSTRAFQTRAIGLAVRYREQRAARAKARELAAEVDPAVAKLAGRIEAARATLGRQPGPEPTRSAHPLPRRSPRGRSGQGDLGLA